MLRDTIAKPPPSGSPGLMIAMGPGLFNRVAGCWLLMLIQSVTPLRYLGRAVTLALGGPRAMNSTPEDPSSSRRSLKQNERPEAREPGSFYLDQRAGGGGGDGMPSGWGGFAGDAVELVAHGRDAVSESSADRG